MNTNTVSGHVLHDEGRSSRGPLLIGVLVVLALLVAAGSILWQGSRAAQTAAPLTGDRLLAANPELKAAQGYAAWSGAAAGEADLSVDAFLARNPELKAVARFAETGDDHAFLAQNPELKAVRRYAALKADE